jgi:hypothetical protein
MECTQQPNDVRLKAYDIIKAGYIPEHYGPSSSEEKLHSKKTSQMVAIALSQIGHWCHPTSGGGNIGDLDGPELHGEIKTVRVTRTTINPKDLNLTSLRRWAGDKTAMIILPYDRLPSPRSSIWGIAKSNDVVITTYAHIAGAMMFKYKGSLHSLNHCVEQHFIWSECMFMQRQAVESMLQEFYSLQRQALQAIDDMSIEELRLALKTHIVSRQCKLTVLPALALAELGSEAGFELQTDATKHHSLPNIRCTAYS